MSFKTSHNLNEKRYRQHKNAQNQRYYERRGRGQYTKRPWTKWEIEQVMLHQIPDTDLSEEIRRSVGAIQGKRNRLKKSWNFDKKKLREEEI